MVIQLDLVVKTLLFEGALKDLKQLQGFNKPTLNPLKHILYLNINFGSINNRRYHTGGGRRSVGMSVNIRINSDVSRVS